MDVRSKTLLQHEATPGVLLTLAAVAALICANFDYFAGTYTSFLNLRGSVSLGELGLTKTVLHWINDGLMAIFFLTVGLEIKREILEGHLSRFDQIALPALAALGGMAVPALVYAAVVWNDPALLRGWAIPAATDIAFSLGALALLGRRVPASLKVFLLTLATFDDLGAIIVIALFYTTELSTLALGLAAAAIAVLIAMNRLGVDRIAPYVIMGIALWVFVLESGVHATLSGVALGLAIPNRRNNGTPLIHTIETALKPYVSFAILPLFAFANAGVPLAAQETGPAISPLSLAVALGLLIGKPVGILLAVAAATGLGISRLPRGATWPQIAGVGCLAGIGFTMSLFIGSLAFYDADQMNAVRLGVLAGSLASMLAGLAILARTARVPVPQQG
jgi:NhaA family Na+:H+ antiporter